MRSALVFWALLLLLPEFACHTRVGKQDRTLSYEELLALTSQQRETIASLQHEVQRLRDQVAGNCAACHQRQPFPVPSASRRLTPDQDDGRRYTLNTQEEVDDLAQELSGNEVIAQELSGIVVITGTVVDLGPLQSIKRIDGELLVLGTTNLSSLQGLNNVEMVNGPLEIKDNHVLQNLDGLEGLERLGEGELTVSGNPKLRTLRGLHNLWEVRGPVALENNIMLEDLTGLASLRFVWGDVAIKENGALKSLQGLSKLEVAGAVRVLHNTNMRHLGGPFGESCRKQVRLRSLDFVELTESECLDKQILESFPRCVTPNEWETLNSSYMDYTNGKSPLAPEGFRSYCEALEALLDTNLNHLDPSLQSKDPGCGPALVSCLWNQPCSINLTNFSIDYRGNVSFPSCGSCGSCEDQTSVEVEDDGITDVAELLRDRAPGNYTLCRCGDSLGPLLQIDLRGPRYIVPDNCIKGKSCSLSLEFDADALEGSQLWLVGEMENCSDPAGVTVQASFNDSRVVFPAEALALKDLRPADYTLCWRPEGAGYESRAVTGASVKVLGPYEGQQYERWFKKPNEQLEIHNTGTAVDGNNTMRLVPSLGPASTCDTRAPDQMRSRSLNRMFIFDLSRLKVGRYIKCWCYRSWSTHCVDTGLVEVDCPPPETVASATQECVACQAGKTFQDRKCVLDSKYWGIIALQGVLLFWIFFLLLVSLGVPIRVQDTYTCSGRLYAATGYSHGLHMYGRTSFPILFSDTKNPLLDRPKEPLRGCIYMSQALRILKANGEPVSECWDTSRGFVKLPLRQELWHKGWPAPAAVLLVLNTVCCIVLHRVPEKQEPMHLACGAAVAVALAMILRVLSRLYCKSSRLTELDTRLVTYRQLLLKKNPRPMACEKGPTRAIALSELHDILEYFAAWIRERNAYYMDTNILGPLTAPYQLSYAEVAGPQQVKWFVSHYWGNTYQDLCKTLKKHAELMTASVRTTKTRGFDLWKEEAYWICFFSNNQYQLADELGTGWDQSSFFLTLRSGYCKGVCLVLDTLAAPLTRAWCIFELLQTLILEEQTRGSNMVDGFKGLHLCAEGGVLNEGQGSAEVTINLVERICGLDLENADASSEQDKAMIHVQVERSLGSFKKMNAKVRHKFDDLLKRAKRQQDSSFHSVYRLLQAALQEDACLQEPGHNLVKGMDVALELEDTGDTGVHSNSAPTQSAGHSQGGEEVAIAVHWPPGSSGEMTSDPLNYSNVVQQLI